MVMVRRGVLAAGVIKTASCFLTAIAMMAAGSAIAATSQNASRHCASEVVKRALTERGSDLIVVDDSEKFRHLRVDGYAGTDIWASVWAASENTEQMTQPVFVYVGPGNRPQLRNQMRFWFAQCLSAPADGVRR